MAYIHEIKFFDQNGELYVALFDQPLKSAPDLEFWLINLPAQPLGLEKLPENINLEQRYKVAAAGIKPFLYFFEPFPQVEFINEAAEIAWKTGQSTIG